MSLLEVKSVKRVLNPWFFLNCYSYLEATDENMTETERKQWGPCEGQQVWPRSYPPHASFQWLLQILYKSSILITRQCPHFWDSSSYTEVLPSFENFLCSSWISFFGFLRWQPQSHWLGKAFIATELAPQEPRKAHCAPRHPRISLIKKYEHI